MQTEEHEITFEIVCTRLPDPQSGGRGVLHLAIQKDDELLEAAPVSRKRIVFRPVLRVRKHADGSPNFLGPFAHGSRTDRFIYLVWTVVEGSALVARLGRIKILLNHIEWADVERALARAKPIKVTLALTDAKGRPVFASIRPDRATWEL